ncbi:hypothetical protein BDZ91DRAFT_793789 [Kalaharituber pfeilii]|nr:hypothetical protein BDZ91DRAFT_793789 [Kalaharituber pfeilii]
MQSVLGSLAILFLSICTYIAHAFPNTVSIQSFTHQGSGCPPGSLNVNLNFPDIITIEQHSYSVNTDSWDTKTCIINIVLDYEDRWAYAVNRTKYSYYIEFWLDEQMMATQTSSYKFPRSSERRDVSRSWMGPSIDSTPFEVYESNLMWSPCERTSLTIENQLSIRNLDWPVIQRNGFVWSTAHEIGLVWTPCE